MKAAENQMTPIKMGKGGIILRCCDEYIVTTKKELAAFNICIRKSGREVVLGGVIKPIYEKKNWDQCENIDRLFASKRMSGQVHKLAPVIVNEFTICDSGGLRTIRPQWCNVW